MPSGSLSAAFQFFPLHAHWAPGCLRGTWLVAWATVGGAACLPACSPLPRLSISACSRVGLSPWFSVSPGLKEERWSLQTGSGVMPGCQGWTLRPCIQPANPAEQTPLGGVTRSWCESIHSTHIHRGGRELEPQTGSKRRWQRWPERSLQPGLGPEAPARVQGRGPAPETESAGG